MLKYTLFKGFYVYRINRDVVKFPDFAAFLCLRESKRVVSKKLIISSYIKCCIIKQKQKVTKLMLACTIINFSFIKISKISNT